MIYPNKHIRFEESIIYKMIYLLEAQEYSEMTISELFTKTISKFQNADEFIYSLDVLYILDEIEIDFENEIIKYVKRN
ncbi:ABC-three component system middle component 7 [Flavobacterium sp. T12S277]|uniref:ABC-three component system middle component 7 n=1 Tax=Flavobacterium sp. T12S277 TaxID=3402752 RepID=UPI003AEC7142